MLAARNASRYVSRARPGFYRRFLAEEVVDAVDLPFLEEPVKLGVQGPGRRQVVAKGLLYRDPALLGEAGSGQTLHHAGEQRRRDLQIEDGQVPPLTAWAMRS